MLFFPGLSSLFFEPTDQVRIVQLEDWLDAQAPFTRWIGPRSVQLQATPRQSFYLAIL